MLEKLNQLLDRFDLYCPYYVWVIFLIDKKKYGIDNDNVTKYGEFVCTTHGWLPIDKQKEEAERLENITKNEKDRKQEK